MVEFKLNVGTEANQESGSNNVTGILKDIREQTKSFVKHMIKPNKEKKKQTNGIVRGLGILGVIASLLASLQPVVDFIKLFVAGLFLLIVKFVKNILPLIMNAVNWVKGIVTGIINLWNAIIEFKNKAIEWLQALPGRIWSFMIGLPERIWGYIVTGFNWLLEKLSIGWSYLVQLKDVFVNKLLELKERFIEKILTLKDTIVEKFKEWKELLVAKFNEWKEILKTKITELWQKLIELKDSLVSAIKDLPSRIWSFVKNLAKDIASAIQNVISNVGSFFGIGGKTTNVNDALITKTGKVVKFNPNDNITATQNSIPGGNKIFNFYGVTPQEMIDTMNRELGVSYTKATRF